MKTMKRTISLILAVIMLLATFCVISFAYEETTADEIGTDTETQTADDSVLTVNYYVDEPQLRDYGIADPYYVDDTGSGKPVSYEYLTEAAYKALKAYGISNETVNSELQQAIAKHKTDISEKYGEENVEALCSNSAVWLEKKSDGTYSRVSQFEDGKTYVVLITQYNSLEKSYLSAVSENIESKEKLDDEYSDIAVVVNRFYNTAYVYLELASSDNATQDEIDAAYAEYYDAYLSYTGLAQNPEFKEYTDKLSEITDNLLAISNEVISQETKYFINGVEAVEDGIGYLTREFTVKEIDSINGNPEDNSKTYSYKTVVTFTANVPEGSSVQWYINGELQDGETGATFTVPAATKSYTVTVIVTDKDGNDSYDEENVEIKDGFFDKVIWLFVHLFVPSKYEVNQ